MQNTSPIPLGQAGELRASEIGGKAASLVRLAQASFRVPDGVVLPVAWFSRWWAELESTEAWARFEKASGPAWGEHSTALRAEAARLSYSSEMLSDLDELRRLVASWGDRSTCAVRSSSPDEDLEAASFAGGYVTVLGVTQERIDAAVRECFVSCLDERVLLYKQQHGFDPRRPRIAVLVQQQVNSDVAGVGFSLNPVSNDFDEAVIDATFGLGETLVSGEVTPDHFVVDKPGRKILERRIGSKGVSRWIRPEGGVELREQDRSQASALTDEQVLEVSDALMRLEELYGHPVDIEWAYAKGELHLLQARPITTYFPLPVSMQTEPGAHRRLYFDGSLTEKFTINAPLTTLSLDSSLLLMQALAAKYRIPIESSEDPEDALMFFDGARMYATYSHLFWFTTAQKLAPPYQMMDVLLYRTLENLDSARYRPRRKPAWLSWGRLARTVLGVLLGMRRMLWNTLFAAVSPARYLPRYQTAIDEFERDAQATPADVPISRLVALNERMIELLMNVEFPPLFCWLTSIYLVESLSKRADPETKQRLDRMARGFEGELVVDMGIEMFALAHLLGPEDFEDLERLEQRIEARELSREFHAAWDAFQKRFGARGPMEMDLRSPRYGDTPALLLRQMSFLRKARPEDDPALAHGRHVAERRQAFAWLMGKYGWFGRLLLRLANRWTEAYASERDTLKYHWVLVGYRMRQTALAIGDRLVKAGRLGSREDVFHLTFAELETAERDPAFDVRSPALERGGAFRKLEKQAKEFPHLIDSRGRILRPAPTPDDGDLQGLGISPGVARGPVKVLHNPYDKDIEPGDVLVAYTTDPGWTPLFINAAAIVLQIGGMMQHGGVVAREYGKPCVAGIEHVLTRFKDGEVVEVDGSSGVVRLSP